MTPEKILLKRATEETVKGVGGHVAAAGFCRIGKSKIGENCSVNHPESFMALDVIADLEPLARDREGWPHVTRALCNLMGGDFVERPVVPAGRGDLMTLLAEQSHEASDLTGVLLRGLADGRLCGAEARQALSEARQLSAITARMIAELQVIVGEEQA